MSDRDNKLEGKWAFVTGSAKRVGATIVRRLHDAGANVAIHYFTSSDDADALTAELNAKRPGSAFAVGANLGKPDELQGLIERVVEQSGRLDLLVNNASSFYPTELGNVTMDDWNNLMGSNLMAPLFLSQGALPYLKEARGSIINMVDIHARRPLRHHHVYGAAKAGLAMLTRSMARDLAPEIRVNGVAPGAILWPEDGMPDRVKDDIVRRIPLAKAGEPDDLASTILFLVCDAPYITGQIIAVDGGRSIGW